VSSPNLQQPDANLTQTLVVSAPPAPDAQLRAPRQPGEALPPSTLDLAEAAGSTAQARAWTLNGSLDAFTTAACDRAVRRRLPTASGQLSLDLSGLGAIDSAGTAWLVDLWRLAEARGFSVNIQGVQPPVLAWLQAYKMPHELPPAPQLPGTFEAVGEAAWDGLQALRDFVVLAADVTVGAVSVLVFPKRFRFGAVMQQASLMGSQALGIVGLITFLIGLTLAFQSAYQLRQFGAAIFVATLTAISMVREMGPLITAIVVAGRSGSSITSEVATMVVGEELDAMQVMGIPFVDFIAVPKLQAMLLTVPLLTVLADALGILGGWIVGTVYLEIAPTPYLQATLDALVFKDVLTGLFKSLVFAWGIALIGLHFGVRVRGGAQEVGKATTASVVTSIFFIIVADSVFSVLFYVVLG